MAAQLANPRTPCLIRPYSIKRGFGSLLRSLLCITRDQTLFALLSGGTFVLLSLALYCVYGFPFLHHTYLYHITRTDHRHNFSPYFYHLYLLSSPETASFLDDSTVAHKVNGLTANLTASLMASPRAMGLAAFLPQVVLLISYSFRYATSGVPRDLALCLFLQTFTFVSFLKVCTSQARFPQSIAFPTYPIFFTDSFSSTSFGIFRCCPWLCTGRR